jgi:hypothetical protein
MCFLGGTKWDFNTPQDGHENLKSYTALLLLVVTSTNKLFNSKKQETKLSEEKFVARKLRRFQLSYD